MVLLRYREFNLGLACYNCGNSAEAISCLRHSNLSDPYDGSVWGLLALCYADTNNLTMVNQCLKSYEKYSKETSEERIEEIKNLIERKEPETFYDESVKENLLRRLVK